MIDAVSFWMEKKNHEILATLQYKPLYNISCSEKWGIKIQAAAYNGARTVFYQSTMCFQIDVEEIRSLGVFGDYKPLLMPLYEHKRCT